MNRRMLVFLGVALVLCSCSPSPAQPPPAAAPLTVFLVRHAEKLDSSSASPLTAEGKRRARALAHMLRDAQIDRIHSSDTVRTRETARPLADRLKQKVELYDAKNLKAFARVLLETEGRQLVVGHSNTTPALVRLLGGKPGGAFGEREYDRIYELTIYPDGTVRTVVLRYGAQP
ncbi:MAG: phosphoglycerate mutase family protein [Myxococcota bacterium]